MNTVQRNNVKITGHGKQAIMFAHGFGCDQNMWRYVVTAFEDQYKVITFDHVGAGGSELSSFIKKKYDKLEGYAADIVEIAEELELNDIIFVGHSVSAIIGIIAAQNAPTLFKSLILIGPSPSYINEGNYVGGFTKLEIDELIESLEDNHLGWSMAVAPVIMGVGNSKELIEELTNSFCRTDPSIAKHFASTTFLSDRRELLSKVNIPTLIMQCSEDIIAPELVGEYVHHNILGSKYILLKATGHCPNLSAPEETITAIKNFLQ